MTNKASFIDFHINICNDRFSVRLYNKHDLFPLNIIWMAYMSGKMPSKIFYTSIGVEGIKK